MTVCEVDTTIKYPVTLRKQTFLLYSKTPVKQAPLLILPLACYQQPCLPLYLDTLTMICTVCY